MTNIDQEDGMTTREQREKLAMRVLENDITEFVPDEWLYVTAESADAARCFFGAPPGWPVEASFNARLADAGLQLWRVKSAGLVGRR
jgi:hypothetical protein